MFTLVYSPDAVLDRGYEFVPNALELAIYEVSIFVVGEDQNLSCKFSEWDYFFPLQLSDVVEHLVLAHFEVVLFEGAHDVGIGSGGNSLGRVVGVLFGTIRRGRQVACPAVQIHLDLLFHLLDLHDLRL